MLFVVVGVGWGYSHSVVRAADADEALRLSGAQGMRHVEVIPLSDDGPPVVLWQVDESPDSPRGRD